MQKDISKASLPGGEPAIDNELMALAIRISQRWSATVWVSDACVRT
jgi:hypothetical protein